MPKLLYTCIYAILFYTSYILLYTLYTFIHFIHFYIPSYTLLYTFSNIGPFVVMSAAFGRLLYLYTFSTFSTLYTFSIFSLTLYTFNI